MPSLSREHRNQLAKAVLLARDAAESGARKALEALAVHEPDPYRHLDEAQRLHRRQLRAQARQLGDGESQTKRGAYEIKHLVEKVAYNQWHRLLFAQFLIENNLLIHPDYQDTGTAVSFEDCEELAPSFGKRDGWAVAAEFAARDLPQIFRADDASGRVELPIEDRNELVQLVSGLPKDVFLADDALGWVYQFWQAKRKEEVNASGNKIGADELSPVTQLFTEDYMVLFLLHNTLGAWWAGKKFADGIEAESEADARASVALPGVDWQYLRFVKNDAGRWVPAAGIFSGWPKAARELRVLDPCMGSGHFLVFALPILVQMRVAEEGLGVTEVCAAVLRDNLFGLELDPRCTQIGAFNLALAAWKLGGWQKPPPMNIACSGVAPNATKESWLRLAGDNDRARRGMEQLYNLFAQAPVLGSLINPCTIGGDLLESSFHDLQPLLEKALAQERGDEAEHELVLTAKGVAEAAELMSQRFHLLSTNVPYLGREGHCAAMMNFADHHAPDGAADLAAMMFLRCLDFMMDTAGCAVVMPQNWWVGTAYSDFRRRVVREVRWRITAVLGEEAWQAFGNRGPNTVLLIAEKGTGIANHKLIALDVSTKPGKSVVGLDMKARALCGEDSTEELQRLSTLVSLQQEKLTSGKHSRISIAAVGDEMPLASFVTSGEGCSTGDNDQFLRAFWELEDHERWLRYAGPGFEHWQHCDNSLVVLWDNGHGALARSEQARIQNTELWTRSGVLVGRVRGITATLFHQGCYSKGAVLICPHEPADLLPLFAFLRSDEFENLVRTIDPRVSAATSVLTDIPFDRVHWQRVAAEKYPNGLPKPFSSNPTQWLFNGHPKGADHPLHVAVARLLGYRWPRQTGSSFPDCPALETDGLERFADDDGIVCISATKGEEPAPERVRALLAAAFGAEWTAGKMNELLAQVDYAGKPLEDWLRNGFFEQHCALFHQRPFIWHVWDGRRDGFSALVNYHKLDRANLEKLTYAYLGDWIRRQQAAVKAGEAGSDARLQAAKELQTELANILKGEPPYDIFVRWKPLARQPLGWEPDLNDGVRVNIRPFLSAKDVGKKGAGILRVRPGVKWDKDRGKEPFRAKEEFPWFWNWDEETTDFKGRGEEPDGNRWNACHYTNEFKREARKRAESAR